MTRTELLDAGGGSIAYTRLVPCVNRLRTACTRTVTISLPKNYNPKEKIQSGQRHYAIVYEEKKYVYIRAVLRNTYTYYMYSLFTQKYNISISNMYRKKIKK